MWRYYQAGLLNTAFGYSSYAAFVWFGANIFVAQLASHVFGMIFNYITFSRHVFRNSKPNNIRYIISYAGNYFLGLGILFMVSRIVSSPYLAGILTIIIVSFVNYFLLRYFVFKRSVHE
ncbi:GtrA family protein [Silvimonas sp.]|uniref:GtrA family protein n=1 Tax=Silvimonas sp. TaxID=2650811 RepID=UPI003863FADB